MFKNYDHYNSTFSNFYRLNQKDLRKEYQVFSYISFTFFNRKKQFELSNVHKKSFNRWICAVSSDKIYFYFLFAEIGCCQHFRNFDPNVDTDCSRTCYSLHRRTTTTQKQVDHELRESGCAYRKELYKVGETLGILLSFMSLFYTFLPNYGICTPPPFLVNFMFSEF